MPAEEPTPSSDPQPYEHVHEDSLEPHHLIRRSDVILRSGMLMLGAGTSSRRVKEVMRAVASALDVDGLSAQVTFTDIVLTIQRRGVFRTQVAEVTKPGVNAERIALLQDLTESLKPHQRVSQVEATLDAIANKPPRYSMALQMIFVALACSSVAVLSNAGPTEVLAVLPASLLGFRLHRLMGAHQINLLAGVVIATAVSAALYLGFVWAFHGGALVDAPRLAAGLMGAVIFLVPGFPLVTGGLDVTRLDLEAGTARLTYAGLVMLSMGLGIWAVGSLAGISPDAVPPPAGPLWLVWTAELLASFFAVFGWATMFNAPPRVAIASGLIAVVGNVPRLLMVEQGVAIHVATFFGALVIGLLCHLVGWAFSMPVLIMTVPTLLVMIPGGPALRALMYFNSGDLLASLGNGISAVLQAIAMVAGLAAAMMLTDPEWAFTRPDPPTLSDVRRRLGRVAHPLRRLGLGRVARPLRRLRPRNRR